MIVITLARKPVIGTVARNTAAHGTGGLNIEDTRCGWVGGAPSQSEWNRAGSSGAVGANGFAGQFSAGLKKAYADGLMPVPSGRWPANLILEHKEGCHLNDKICEDNCSIAFLDVEGLCWAGGLASRYFKQFGGNR